MRTISGFCHNSDRRYSMTAITAVAPFKRFAGILRAALPVILLFAAIPLVRGQNDTASSLPEYKKYHWDSIPKIDSLPEKQTKMNELVIKDKRIIEYFYDKPGNISMYVTVHKIIRVNSPEAIENNNTVYISMSNVTDFVSLQARSITPNGKVIPLNPANIKDVDNYSNMGPYRIFAIDGIEAGGEIEYLYTLREPFKLTDAEYIRGKTLIKDFEVDIYSPSDLIFEAKSYNGFPRPVTDTTLVNKHLIYAKAADVTGRKEEDFSAGDACQMRMEYKFTYNTNLNPQRKLYTYDDFSAKMFELIDQTATKKDRKTASEFIDSLDLPKLAAEPDKIRRIERSIKKLITVDENATGDKYLDAADIIKGKLTNELGIIKLYYLIFEAAGINNEIVATTDRFVKAFDPDFESWTYLQKYMFFFPETGQYIAPTESFSRYGYPPFGWICQKGLFIHPVSLGKFNTGVGEIKEIDCNDWKKSMNDIYADMTLNKDMDAVNIKFRESMTGYEINEYGQSSLYAELSEEEQKDFINNFMKATFPDAKINSDSVSGYKEDEPPGSPFTVTADITTNSLLEQAGDKYIFKIGLVIGPQSELYLDTLRQSPVELQYNHGYHRVLKLLLPDGYKATNLDALNISVSDGQDSSCTMEFRSAYSVSGDSITVIIDEDYRQISYPVAMYEKFRKVINASADFNKIVIFLEKK